MRRCKHWPAWYGEPRFWARFARGAGDNFGFIQTIVHAADDPVEIEGVGGVRCYAAVVSLPHWNFDPSIHLRCMMTASLRAIATRVRWRPFVLCSRMPQAFRDGHLRVLTANVKVCGWLLFRVAAMYQTRPLHPGYPTCCYWFPGFPRKRRRPAVLANGDTRDKSSRVRWSHARSISSTGGSGPRDDAGRHAGAISCDLTRCCQPDLVAMGKDMRHRTAQRTQTKRLTDDERMEHGGIDKRPLR